MVDFTYVGRFFTHVVNVKSYGSLPLSNISGFVNIKLLIFKKKTCFRLILYICDENYLIKSYCLTLYKLFGFQSF
jgi:hypothetical protein